MRLSGVSVVSTLALLLAAIGVHGCPTLKASGRKAVVAGRTSLYTLRVATGSTAVDDATVMVRRKGRAAARQSTSNQATHHDLLPSLLH